MKKSIFLFFALVAGAINLFADECEQTPIGLAGTATVTFSRYEHKLLTGPFSISESEGVKSYVIFSQGNLQYKGSTQTWRFAENQWDTIGSANANILSTYDGWIDLFGFGCSGWRKVDSLTAYCPYHFATSAKYTKETLTGSNRNADWAYYNTIVNGGIDANGPAAGQWRVLLMAEWDYLFQRKDASDKLLYGYGSLMGVNGLFLLPDTWDWDEVDGGTFEDEWTSATDAKSFSNNTLSDAAIWEALENKGLVFLPTGGYRTSKAITTGVGYYWSATSSGVKSDYSKSVYFMESTAVDAKKSAARYRGCSVRAIRDIDM